jgi:N-methylhydantoinase A
VYFGDGFVDAVVLDGQELAAGSVVPGPALIEERFTVIVVPPGWTATLGEHAAYELVRD